MVDVILVEDTVSESALAYIAIALRRPGTRVAEARSLEQAAELVRRNGEKQPVVILGPRAVRQGMAAFTRAVAGSAAVAAVQARPFHWKEYAAAIASIVDRA